MFALLLALGISGSSVYVMAPLDLFLDDQNFRYWDKFISWLDKLKNNVDGLMVDVWWGLCETAPKTYKFSGYRILFEQLKQRNIKIIPVMSFHKCGGNVGDKCDIPIPSFVRDSPEHPFFKDQYGNIDDEYISFGYDETSINGRTPIKMYEDFMEAFKNEFQSFISSGDIIEIEVGVGPCGELRYPSYQMKYWTYPGCGAFQSYDDKLSEKLSKDAAAEGKSGFGHNPYNVGDYNAKPGSTQFWNEGSGDGWRSDYGQWFANWYAKVLIDHGKKVFEKARNVFGNTRLSSKIAGIHWWYMVPCHCAEITAGLRNFQFYDGYRDILTSFKQFDIECCFTCLELTPDSGAGSNPAYLVQQIINDCGWAGLDFEGENALECYDKEAFGRIREWVSKGLKKFTFLRLGDTLMQDNNWNTFRQFVNDMHNA